MELAALDGTNGFALNGIAAGDVSGTSVSAAGDINGDGVDDLLVGARSAAPNGKLNAGQSYVVFGQKVMPVKIDLRPGRKTNCIRNNARGVIPVAILGSQTLDVTHIDPETVRLEDFPVATGRTASQWPNSKMSMVMGSVT